MTDLTVIIPSRDAGARLDICLEALARQRGAEGRFEVVVVDDGSDPPVTDVRAAVGSAPVRLVRRDEAGGIAVARNAGWQSSAAAVALFLDDDIVADPGLVAGHLAVHDQAPRSLGIGRLVTKVGPDADALAQRFAEAWARHVVALDDGRSLRPTDAYGGDLSVPVEALRRTGGFDPAFARSEDIELAARLVDEGYALAWVRGQSVHHERKTGADMIRDATRNGAFGPRLIERHPSLLPATEAGGYAGLGQRQLALRRALTRSQIDPQRLAPLVRVIPKGRSGTRGITLVAHHAYWTGVRTAVDARTYRRMTDGVAILMYHGFAPAGAPASRYVVPIDRFEAQLRGLLERGHRPLALGDYLEQRRGFRFPPARSFIVTIDDAYAEVATLAAPVLRDLGIPATVFVVDGQLGGHNDWDHAPAMRGRPLLDADAIERLAADRVAIGAHGATHVALAGLGDDRLDDEVAGSIERLTARFGPLVPAFAYPFGSADDAARAAIARAGVTGLGVREGLASPVSSDLELPRIEVQGTDGPRRLALATRIGGTRRLVRP